MSGTNRLAHATAMLSGVVAFALGPWAALTQAAQDHGAVMTPRVAGDDVLLGGWTKRLQIPFTGYTRATTLTNFPALVVLGPQIAGFSYGDFTSGSYDDLRFTDADGMQFLNYEVERWDTNGSSYVWVQVPALQSGTSIRAYYGKSGETAPASTTNGVVWNDGYRSVWHLNEGTGTLADATTNRNAGVPQGGVTQGATGLAGRGLQLDGTNDYLATTQSYAGPNVFTLSAWFRTTTTNGGKLVGFGKSSTGASSSYDRHLYLSSGGVVYGGVYNGSVQTLNSVASKNDGVWHQAALTLSAAGLVMYVDGACLGTNTATTGEGFTGYWRVGYDNVASWPNAPGSYFYQGALDEVRVEHVARPADWVWAEWMNMASNATYSPYGAVESVDPTLAGVATLAPGDITTGLSATAVWVFWGESDPGATTEGWAGMSSWDAPAMTGAYAYAATLPADRAWVYRYAVSNDAGWAFGNAQTFLTAPVSIARVSDASEIGLVPGTFTVSRAESSTGVAVTVAYAVTGGTASNGTDYVTLGGSLVLPAGVAAAPIVVIPKFDRNGSEGDESVEVGLGAGRYPMGVSKATLTLADQPSVGPGLTLIWDNNVATRRWDTADLNWHTAGSDPGSAYFMDGDAVEFQADGAGSVNLAGDRRVQSLVYTVGCGGITVRSNALWVGSGGIRVVSGAGADQSIASVLALTADAAVSNETTWPNNRVLNLNGAVEAGTNALTLDASGSSSSYVNGPIRGRRVSVMAQRSPDAGGDWYLRSGSNDFSGPFRAGGKTRIDGSGAVRVAQDIRVQWGLLRLGWTDANVVDDGVTQYGRLPNGATVTVARGTVSLVGKDNTPTTERIGVLRLNDGFGAVQVNAGGGTGTATWVVGALSREQSGAAHVGAWNIDYCNEQTLNLGSGSYIKFADAGASVLQAGGGGGRMTDKAIVPYFVTLAPVNNGRPNTLVRYDAANGLMPLDCSNDFVNATGASFPAVDADGNDNVRLPWQVVHPESSPESVTVTLASDAAINALVLDNDKTNAVGRDLVLAGATGVTLTVKSGVVLSSPSGPYGQQGGVTLSVPKVAFGEREGMLLTWGDWSALRVSSALSGRQGLTTVSGGPELRLQGDNRGLTGTVCVAGGSLSVDSRDGLGNNSNAVYHASGATLLPWVADHLTVASLSGFGGVDAQWNATGKRLNIGGDGSGSSDKTLKLLAGGAIRPGSAAQAGVLTIGGFASVVFAGGTLELDLAGPTESDRLVLTKLNGSENWPALTITGTSIKPVPAYVPAVGESFLAVQVGTNYPVVGKFTEQDSVTVQVRNKLCTFDILYNSSLAGGDGNDIVLRVASVVGVPGCLLLVN